MFGAYCLLKFYSIFILIEGRNLKFSTPGQQTGILGDEKLQRKNGHVDDR